MDVCLSLAARVTYSQTVFCMCVHVCVCVYRARGSQKAEGGAGVSCGNKIALSTVRCSLAAALLRLLLLHQLRDAVVAAATKSAVGTYY